MRLHHVAYVVPDLDAALPDFTGRFGMTEVVREVMDAQGVEALMMRAGDGFVELIRPLDPEGPIARFLETRGGGLHHVAYAVNDIARTLHGLAEQGVELIDPEPRVGLGGHLVAFIHPRSGHGALTELVQEAH
ncbi:MAG: methylmalonyl-CoA epimerase [Thermoleophilia bacterium]|nr:methylmalonyl-CoA epimerase [Thermoleophilia bacterium]